MAQVAIALAITAASTGLETLFAPKPKKPDPIDRGKLDDARFSIPALGAAIPKGWGTFRCAPIWIDHTPTLHTVEVTEGQSGGKGGGGTLPTADERKHIYTKSVIGVFHNGLLHKGVSKMWFGEKLVYNSNLATNEADTSALRGEAEHGVLSGGASVANQSECSGGKKVTGIGNGGVCVITVDVPTTGSYEIACFYTSTADRTFKISVNGGSLFDLFCPASGGASEVTSEVAIATLTAGANTIRFENSGAACPDLDRIDVAPALVFAPTGEDPRGFTGITKPGRFGPTDQDFAWPMSNEQPVFSEAAGGVTNGGFSQAVLAEWGNPTIRFYNGSELQPADPVVIALRGLDLSPGYRGLGVIAIDNIQLQNGQMPNVTLEVQQGTRELPAIVADIYNAVGIPSTWLDLSALNGKLLGDESGFDPGTYSAITWTGLNNATQTGDGAITKTSGTDNTWNSYANSGDSISAGTNASIRFTAGNAGTYMIGFGYTTTPGSTLPHPYDQVPFAVLLNKNSNPSQESKNAIQLSIGGSNNTYDIGVWSPGDKFQIEYRNGRFTAYQNGLALTGYVPPVPSTFPLRVMFLGYTLGGGPSATTFATGANIGTEPIVANGGGLYMESPKPAAEMIAALMLRFQFTLPEVDGVVKAVLNNASSDLTIDYKELRAHRGDQRPTEDMVITRADPLTLAKRTTVTYSDPAYSYHTRTQSEPRLYGPQQGVNDVVLPMIETAQNMKNLAITISNREEIEGQTYKLQLGPKYQRIHQGTVLTINARSGTQHTVRVKELGLELPAGIIDIEGVRQDAAVFSPNGAPADVGTESPVVALPGNTKGMFLDVFVVDPENSEANPVSAVYVAMSGRGSGKWPGAFLYREFPRDSGNYTLVTSADKPATTGLTDSVLGSIDIDDIDSIDAVNTVIVDLYFGELASVSEAELLANKQLNLIYIGNEYLQFQTVTPLTAAAPFVSRYELSDLLRGRFHTQYEVGVHVAGEDVVLMNSALKALPMDILRLGVEERYKFVTVGMGLDVAPETLFTWQGNNLRPSTPSGIVVYRDTKTGATANQIQIITQTRAHAGGEVLKNWVDVFSATAGPTFTVDAATNTFTSAAHGLTSADVIALSTSGVLPMPLQVNAHYYLRDVTANTFKLAQRDGGAAIDLADTGTGTHKFTRRVRHMPVINIGAFNPAVLTIYTPNDIPPPNGEWQHATAAGSGGWNSTITTEWTQRNNVVGDGPGAAGSGINAAALSLITEPGAEVEFTLGSVIYAPFSETLVFLGDPDIEDDFGSLTAYRQMKFTIVVDTDLPAGSTPTARRWKLTIHERATAGGALNLVYTDPGLELPGMKYRMQLSGSELRYYRDYGGPNSQLLYRSTAPLILPTRLKCEVASVHRIDNIKIGGLPECVTTYPDTDMISDFGTQPSTVRLRVYEERVVSGVSFLSDAVDFIT